MSIHPKTSGAALGAATGVLIVAILQSIHGLTMASELPAAITGFTSLLGSFLFGDPATPVTAEPPITVTVPAPPVTPPTLSV